MSRVEITIASTSDLRTKMQHAWSLVTKAITAGPVVVSLGRPQRSLSQNRKLWPMLSDVSRQVNWYGQMLAPESWKDIFTAALKKQKAVPGIDGGFVVLGARTSKMSKSEFTELIELIYAFGTQQGVTWSEPALAVYAEYREAQQGSGAA